MKIDIDPDAVKTSRARLAAVENDLAIVARKVEAGEYLVVDAERNGQL